MLVKAIIWNRERVEGYNELIGQSFTGVHNTEYGFGHGNIRCTKPDGKVFYIPLADVECIAQLAEAVLAIKEKNETIKKYTNKLSILEK